MNKEKNIILSRILKNKATNQVVNIYIYQPIQEDETTWYSLIAVGEIEKKVYGIDSIQVMILSISTIREILLNEISDKLEWFEDSNFLGFPLFVPMSLSDFEIAKIEGKLQNEIDNTLNKRIKDLEKYLEKQSYDIHGETLKSKL